MFKQRVAVRIQTVIKLLLILPIIGMSIWVSSAYTTIEKEKNKHRVEKIGEMIKQQLDQYLATFLSPHSSLPRYNAIFFKNIAQYSEENLIKTLQQSLSLFPQLYASRFVDNKKHFLYAERLQDTKINFTSHLASYENVVNYYTTDVFTDQLQLLYSEPCCIQQKTPDYLSRRYDSSKWAPIFISPNTQQLVLPLVFPTTSIQSDILTSIEFNLSQLSHYLRQLNVPEGVDIFIFEPTGEVVASSQSSHIVLLQNKGLKRLHVNDPDFFPFSPHTNRLTITKALLSQAPANFFSLPLSDSFLYSVKIKAAHNLEWRLLLHIPKKSLPTKDYLLPSAMYYVHWAVILFITLLCIQIILYLVLKKSTIFEQKKYLFKKIKKHGIKAITLQQQFEEEQKNIKPKYLSQRLPTNKVDENSFIYTLQNLPIGVILIHVSYKVCFVNQQAKQLLGRHHLITPPLQDIAKTYQLYIIGTDTPYPLHRRGVLRVFKGHRTKIDDIEIQLPNRRTPLELWALPIFNHEGNISHAILTLQDISTRKHYESALNNTRQQFTHLLEVQFQDVANNIPGVLYQWYERTDGSRGFYYISPRCKELYGVSPEQLKENYHLLPIHPDDLPRWRDSITASINNKIEWSFEGRFILPAGEIRWWRGMAKPVNINEKETVFNGIIIDISDEKEMEQALRASESNLSNSQRMAKLGGWVWDMRTDKFIRSVQDCLNVGLDPDNYESSYQGFIDCVHPDDRAKVLKILETACKGKNAIEFEFRTLLHSGEIRFLRARSELEFDQFGLAICMRGFTQDITHYKVTQQALQESKNRFKSIFNNAAVGIGVVNLTGCYIQTNARWRDLLQYSSIELQNLTKWDVIYPDNIPELKKYFNHLTKGYIEYYQEEIRFKRKDGTVFWGGLWASPIYDKDNKITAEINIITDLTLRKHAEKNAEKARLEAEAANQAKSNFLANMSHELRTPLNGILGYTQILLSEGQLTEKQQKGLDIIEYNADYLLTLISDILDLSKIEVNKITLRPIQTPILPLLNGVVELFRLRTQQKHLDFHYEILSALPNTVDVDDKRLRQVLINILGNAVKFTDQGSIRFIVKYRDGKIYFEVKDTGIGIPADEVDTIFVPFKQLGEQKYRAQGTGLGLAITYKLVTMMGGHIYVKSVLNRGSTFWIELPLSGHEKLTHLPNKKISKRTGYQGVRKKILIVDDLPTNREILKRLLLPLGFEVYEAANGEEGVQQARQITPDLILMDLVMPIMNGIDATRCIRHIDALKEVVIITVSASVFEEDRKRCLDAGCNDFLAKPIYSQYLYDMLANYLHITWQYKHRAHYVEQHSHAHTKKEQALQLLEQLTVEENKKLLDLAMRGNVNSLLDYLSHLEQEKPELSLLLGILTDMVKQYKFKNLRTMLKTCHTTSKQVDNSQN